MVIITQLTALAAALSVVRSEISSELVLGWIDRGNAVELGGLGILSPNHIPNNGTHLNLRRPTFPLVDAPSGNARSGRRDSKITTRTFKLTRKSVKID